MNIGILSAWAMAQVDGELEHCESVTQKLFPEIGVYLNRYNPLAFLISSMRQSLIYSECPNLLYLGLWLLISLLLAIGGITLIYKEENSYLKAV